ncbi:MAG: type II toxin-antitoxin system HigB family toxin [Phycisphaerales bacterium]|jgi:mRNA interferase HigB|nr:type II toxin-antitoxin system HigB family toxin [Phycisphaerales bacterium]
MLILGLARIEKDLKRNAAARGPMRRWIEKVESAQWQSIIDVRRMFPTADAIKGTNLTCFNIGGNNYRLLTVIRYVMGEVEVRELLTHAEYSGKIS